MSGGGGGGTGSGKGSTEYMGVNGMVGCLR